MKKLLFLIIMLGALILWPMKPMAMLEVDENGNPIDKEIKEGEVTTMIAPDEGVSSDSTTSDELKRDNKSSVSDPDLGKAEPYGEDIPAGDEIFYTTTGVEEDAAYDTVSAPESAQNGLVKESKTLPTAVVSGGLGALIGATVTFFVLSRKKI